MNKTDIAKLVDAKDGLSDDSYEDLEDGIIKDSVLKLTSNNFDDISPDDFVGAKLRNRNIASQNDIETEYKGVPVSRKIISKGLDSDGSGEDAEVDDDEEDYDNSDEGESGSASEADFTSVSEGEGDNYEDENNSSIEDDDSLANEPTRKNVDISKKQSKGDTVDSEENYNLYSKGAQNVTDDIEKGNAIRYQISIWESLLECRIKFQKALAACNRLPQGNKLSTILSNLSDSDRNAISKTRKNIASLLRLLLSLQKDMVNSYPDFAVNAKKGVEKSIVKDKIVGDDDDDIDDSESVDSSIASGFLKENEDNVSNSEAENDESSEPPRKLLKLDDFARELKKQHEEFIPIRNRTIQKWNDKTRISSGHVKSSNFSAFDQSTLKQIEQILSDKSRLIKRTQTKRSVYSIIGEEDDIRKNESEQAVDLDPEIFDDDDFYHKLLREFIEQKSSDVTNPQQMGRQWVELQKMRSKMKRPIDVKATKGRRLRYMTHNKLVNFMAPIPYNSWTDEGESELFSSLFGEIRGEK